MGDEHVGCRSRTAAQGSGRAWRSAAHLSSHIEVALIHLVLLLLPGDHQRASRGDDLSRRFNNNLLIRLEVEHRSNLTAD